MYVSKCKNYHFIFYCIIVFFYLPGCQSPQRIAGSDHKLVVDKWNALSQYAHGVLNQYDISLGTRLSVNENNGIQAFHLSDFKFLRKTSALQIDLLAPSFNHKIICTPECSFLNEYIDDYLINATLLKQYFDEVEFELFKFYGDIVLLEGILKTLEEIDENLFAQYLRWLIAQNKGFNSLNEFTDYLNEKLSEDEFFNFINDPIKMYSLIELDKSLDVISPFENDISNRENSFIAKELLDIEPEFMFTKPNDLQEIPSVALESELWTSIEIGADGLISVFNSNDIDWQSLKGVEILIGEQVCSYEENYFGFVTEIVGRKFLVFIVGQMKEKSDSILKSAMNGAIFSQTEEQYFSMVKQNITFMRDEIAPCNVAYLTNKRSNK